MKRSYYGEKFGRLIIIDKRVVSIKDKVLCRCECGNEKYIIIDSLMREKTKSCGCLQKERASKSNKKDLTGKRFGRLVVLFEEEKFDKYVRWRCHCDCGNEVCVYSSCLLKGHTKSCGCLQKERASESNSIDLTGKQFGFLKVVERVGSDKRGELLWKCQCECGNESIVLSGNLSAGRSRSCGCLKSIGELEIGCILRNHNVSYVQQKSFDGCVNIQPLSFDFYIPDKNCCIEFDGEQHFYAIDYFGGEEKFLKTQINDMIKTEYCEKNKIFLLRINYNDADFIEDILLENGIIKESSL